MKTKYTPAPWHVTQDVAGETAVNDHTQFHSTFPIAVIYGRLDQKEANAQLIAAAPELLEALVELLNHADKLKLLHPRYDRARAALRKAGVTV